MSGLVGIRSFSNSGTIAAGADYAPFGDQPADGKVLSELPFLNFLDILNTSTETIEVRLDGATVRTFFVSPNNGRLTVSPDSEFKIRFQNIIIRNAHASATISANEIKTNVGRVTG
jgi:hypothetical protein